MRTRTSDAARTRDTHEHWRQGTSALGHVMLAALAVGAGALLWKQLPDLRRYFKMRSM